MQISTQQKKKATILISLLVKKCSQLEESPLSQITVKQKKSPVKILSLPGKITYLPPAVNSPRGNYKVTNKVNMTIKPNNMAPSFGIILSPLYFEVGYFFSIAKSKSIVGFFPILFVVWYSYSIFIAL